jgi:DNA-binding CsgD family transcriptional regulator
MADRKRYFDVTALTDLEKITYNFYRQGLTLDEIAERMNASKIAIKNRLSKAKEKIACGGRV